MVACENAAGRFSFVHGSAVAALHTVFNCYLEIQVPDSWSAASREQCTEPPHARVHREAEPLLHGGEEDHVEKLVATQLAGSLYLDVHVLNAFICFCLFAALPKRDPVETLQREGNPDYDQVRALCSQNDLLLALLR